MAAKKKPAPQQQETETPRVVALPHAMDGYDVAWQPNPGPQTEILLRPEYELLYGGAKGGGKTAAGIMWLVTGNPNAANPQPVDISYINHPYYRALVLRRNRADMEYWISEAKKIYKLFGAVYTANPSEFTFESGAKIVIGHLAEDGAWEKYAGNEVQRILIEEATQIPSYRLYSLVVANCRSKYKELRPQILLTANPGGPGHGWISKRFLTTTPASYKRTLVQKIADPVTGKVVEITRAFIPAKVTDNPKILETDPTYAARLSAQYANDENLRRALLDGDWNALAGQYFTAWRPNGPLGSETALYPWARHVIEPIRMEPHWHRWISMDWGYKHHSVAHWFCQHPNGQVHVYREIAFAGMTPEQFGVEIALASLADLDGLTEHRVDLWLSPDAFGTRTSEQTIADQVKSGICSVLGPTSAYILTGKDIPGADERDVFDLVDFQQRQAGIAIRRAQNHRVAGWMYTHSLMRFKPLVQNEDKFDADKAIGIAHDLGAEEYFKYIKYYQRTKEALPLLQVHSTCPRTIAAIPAAMHDEEHDPNDVLKTDEPEDDVLDSLRYGCMAHKYTVAKEPLKNFVAGRISDIQSRRSETLTGHSIMQIAAKAERDWAQQSTAEPINIPRASGRSRRWRN